MAVATLDEIYNYALNCCFEAIGGARRIKFSKAASQFSESLDARSLEEEPRFAELRNFYGSAEWASILSVDLRQSTKRALEIGPRDTYVTMHTFLPTLISLVEKCHGSIVGLRGDGLIAAFGLVERNGVEGEWTPDAASEGVKQASTCGKAMIDAVDLIINPILVAHRVDGGLQIGVGIDAGDIVITRIGLKDTNDITAYGNAVNKACHLHNGWDQIHMSRFAKKLWKGQKGGKIRFGPISGDFSVIYPDDYQSFN